MNENSVDKFLLANKVKIEDDGFTERVMQSLPANVNWKRRLNRIWNCICIFVLVAFCCLSDVMDKLLVDIEVYAKNLPIYMDDISWWYGAAVIIIAFYGLVIFGGKRFIEKN